MSCWRRSKKQACLYVCIRETLSEGIDPESIVSSSSSSSRNLSWLAQCTMPAMCAHRLWWKCKSPTHGKKKKKFTKHISQTTYLCAQSSTCIDVIDAIYQANAQQHEPCSHKLYYFFLQALAPRGLHMPAKCAHWLWRTCAKIWHTAPCRRSVHTDCGRTIRKSDTSLTARVLAFVDRVFSS